MEQKTKDKKEKTYLQIVLQMLKEMVLATIVAIIMFPFIVSFFSKSDEKSEFLKTYGNDEYVEYQKIKEYSGEYDFQKKVIEKLQEEKNLDGSLRVMDYQEYTNFCKTYNLVQKYSDTKKKYITYCGITDIDVSNITMELIYVEYQRKKVNLYIMNDINPQLQVTEGLNIYSIIIPTSKKVDEISIKSVHPPEADLSGAKPIIYLYPEVKTEINVKLGYPENITCSYPKYPNEGWKVEAEPNGDLKYIKNQRELYSLYYENKTKIDFKVENEGFIVKSEDTTQFLEEKLEILGLNSKEAEEFIIYWLPRLEGNNYNYIRFATEKEIEENMPLNINPVPDTIIRVLMIYKGLEEPIQINEQELTTPARTGYVAVEWGGIDLK